MPVQDTDLFLVNRGGASYKVQAQNLNNMQDTDIVMIDDGGVTKKVPKSKWLDIPDSAWTLCNSGGTSYKVSGTNFKNLLALPPFRGAWSNAFFIGNDAAGWDTDENNSTQISQNNGTDWSIMTFGSPINASGTARLKGFDSGDGRYSVGVNIGLANQNTRTADSGQEIDVSIVGSTISNIGIKPEQGFVVYFQWLKINGNLVTDDNRGIF